MLDREVMLRALPGLALLLALLAASPARAEDEERARALGELAELAPRIEALKRDAQAGRGHPAELLRLLSRAQELADRLDRPAPAPAPRSDAGPDARELRERADALRDRADRLAAGLRAVEERLRAARRHGALAEALDHVSGGSDPFAESAARRPTAPSPAAGSAALEPTPGVSGAVAPPAALGRAVRAPAAPDGAGLLPADGDDLAALRRKRAALGAALAGLAAQAAALDAEARALDASR